MLNFFFISLILFAIIYVAYTYTQLVQNRTCDKVEYKYRPHIRTFREEQMQPVSPFGLYQDLFYKASPWWDARVDSAQLHVGSIQPATWVGLPKDKTIREGEPSDWQNNFFS